MTRKRKQSLDGRSFHQIPLTLTGYEAMKRVVPGFEEAVGAIVANLRGKPGFFSAAVDTCCHWDNPGRIYINAIMVE
jgi:hypothetical protein